MPIVLQLLEKRHARFYVVQFEYHPQLKFIEDIEELLISLCFNHSSEPDQLGGIEFGSLITIRILSLAPYSHPIGLIIRIVFDLSV
jgi:hypothetical protein